MWLHAQKNQVPKIYVQKDQILVSCSSKLCTLVHKTQQNDRILLDNDNNKNKKLDAWLHITTYNINGGTSMDCILECQHHTGYNIHIIIFISKPDVLILYTLYNASIRMAIYCCNV